jgi:uncharacterized membrane protein
MKQAMRIVGGIIVGVIVMMMVVLPKGAAWAQGYLGQQGSVGVITITGLIALVLLFCVLISLDVLKTRLNKQNKFLEEMCKQLQHISRVLDPKGEAFSEYEQHQRAAAAQNESQLE